MNTPSIPATISIPRGYQILGPNALKKKGDLELVMNQTANVATTKVGDWHPVQYVGETVDFAGNHTIRPIQRKVTRRPVRRVKDHQS